MPGWCRHATCDALTPVLLRGCHRAPNGDILPMLHTSMDVHESPEAFYSRTFLQLLRIPALKNMGFSQEDVYALEDCLRQALMNLPLPQALDFLHSQLLSSMCISPPARKDNNPPAPFASPPLKRHFQWPSGTADPPPSPPSFHVWITSVVMPSHGLAFVGVLQGNINLVSIPVISSNLFSLPLLPFLPNPGFSPLPYTSLRLHSKAELSSKTRTRSAILARRRSLNSWALFCLSSCTTLSRSPGVRALRPSPRHSTSFVYPYWTASTPLLKPASCHLSPCHYLFSSRSPPFQAFSNTSSASRFIASRLAILRCSFKRCSHPGSSTGPLEPFPPTLSA